MKVNLKHEYVLIVLSLLLLIFVNFSNMTIIRTLVGLPYALLVPGYLLTAALFPKADDLDVFDRLALSMGLSIIIVPFLGMLQNYMSLGIRLFPMMFSVTLLIIVLALPGLFIRNKLPEEERFAITLEIDFKEWRRLFKENKSIHGALLMTSLVIFITILYMLFCPKIGSRFTEFYITGLDRTAAGYPEKLQSGDYGVVRACVINHEQQKAIYRMEIRVEGEIVKTITPISLNHLEKLEEAVFFNVTSPKNSAKVEFLLFKDNQNTAPYRQLKLWVKVGPATNAGSKVGGGRGNKLKKY